MTNNPTFRQFFESVLRGIGAPPRVGNKRALAVIAIVEGAATPSAAGRFNPLNSVIPFGDSVDFNSTHVQNYRNFQNGVQGTIALFNQPRWAPTKHALQTAWWRAQVLEQFALQYRSWGDTATPALFPQITTDRITAMLNTRMP